MEPMSRKGISPLVATVLLIAATMSIALILSYWASSFVRTTLPPVNTTQQQCQFSDFEIYQCSYSISGSNITVTLHNLRQNALGDMVMQVFFINGSVSQTYNLTSSLPGGNYQGFTVPGIPSTFSKIVIGSRACTGVVADKESACVTVA